MKKTINLWENDVPYFDEKYNQKEPSIVEFFIESEKKRPCVLVIPGGAYSMVSTKNEGEDICKELNSYGISAAYLNYRVAPYKHPVMETDAKRAIRLLKYNAEKWGIDKEKIGVVGFSAGGHLSCMTGLRFDEDDDIRDEIDKMSSRPDTVAVGYGVCSLDPEITHLDTLHNLLGKAPDEKMIKKLSSENIVKENTPPFFLWHTAEDTAVMPENSLKLANMLIKEKVPCELHIFPYGPHGLGNGKNTPLANEWIPLYVKWLNYYGFCPKKVKQKILLR